MLVLYELKYIKWNACISWMQMYSMAVYTVAISIIHCGFDSQVNRAL